MASLPSYLEDHISQIPALRLLMAMGWEYLPPEEALRLRGGKTRNIILEGVLLDWVRRHNHIVYKGQRVNFTEANIASILHKLKSVDVARGLIPASEEMYDLLVYPISVEQIIEGNKRSYDIHVIDWQYPENNVYHVTDEYSVERRGTTHTRRPDLVLFVNGIPLVIIECKRPDKQASTGDTSIAEAIRQLLVYQQLDDQIPHLFVPAQLLMAINTNEALYGAIRTERKFWAVWQEEDQDEAALMPLINAPLTSAQKYQLYNWRDDGGYTRRYFDTQEAAGTRLPTAQDRSIAALLSPRRLLELAYQYIVYDNGQKKIARYQQYFAITAAMQRVTQFDGDGRRIGGLIWHTTGSGKSLTMVMLAKALALHPTIRNPRVIIVTDRIDLDAQIWKTFSACGKTVVRADSGNDLIKLLRDPKNDIITTVVDKFEAAARSKFVDTNRDIFVLVDESHRGQYGSNHARMIGVLPMACYIGFTGTPLLAKEKSTAEKFGGIIHAYSMRQAVADQAVLPLLYEGRMVELDVSRDALDQWFERRTATLNEDQKTSLKRKMSRFDEVNRTRSRLEAIAWDIAEHYKKTFRGTGFKGQLATASKELAILYRQCLRDEGIDCEVIISAPDMREGSDDGDEDTVPEVQKFWKQTMHRYSTEDKYLSGVLGDFHDPGGCEILIVVDKLLVGFDEPRNTVLYIDKPLREHGLLQAIARVNRLYPGKDYGYLIDYRGVLGELNEAMQTYNALEAYDPNDVAGTVTDMSAVAAELPSLHDHVWAIFDPVPNKQDQEALERYLEPEDRRQAFYEALNAFTTTLKIALSMADFYETTPETLINTYKRNLLFFDRLRSSVKLRYAETVDYGEYEQKIRKLLNDHIKAEGVHTLVAAVNIFDEVAFEAVVESMTDGARADTIANQIKKTATERMDEDPAFYRKFSQLIDETLQAYREGRLSEAETLQRVESALSTLRQGRDSGLPPQLATSPEAIAYYGLLAEMLIPQLEENDMVSSYVADLALTLSEALDRLKVRDWTTNPNRIDRMKGALEDVLYTFSDQHKLALSGNELDLIIDSLVDISRKREAL